MSLQIREERNATFDPRSDTDFGTFFRDSDSCAVIFRPTRREKRRRHGKRFKRFSRFQSGVRAVAVQQRNMRRTYVRRQDRNSSHSKSPNKHRLLAQIHLFMCSSLHGERETVFLFTTHRHTERPETGRRHSSCNREMIHSGCRPDENKAPVRKESQMKKDEQSACLKRDMM